ncbi:MAG: hypothetical protein JWN03_4093 [Nocardia sp.]|uniref:hypothetical protein n=1 Tax=Nocardia sp. TaxID=1821 RepID=UPI002602422F|nr:hypothetical protein [Nocardia sp.]MCU1643818.1 hypothetical protein [Nocardia sp.]
MTDRPAVAGIQEFSSPDKEKAVAVAEALSAYGFERVVVQPLRYSFRPDMEPAGWRILAVDEGPYDEGKLGDYQLGIIGRNASAIAEQIGARWVRPYWDVGELERPGTGEQSTFVNPGARPPVPSIQITIRSSPAGFNGLDDVEWTQLSHAYGSAEDIPGLLRELLEDHWNWDKLLNELFFGYLVHQGTCYSASAPALAFAAKLTEPGTLPADQRCTLYQHLRLAVGEWTERQVAAIRADHQPPLRPDDEWAKAVVDSIGAELPAMLGRWNIEPPMNKYNLAILAAVFPDHGRLATEQVGAFASALRGTRHGPYLGLAAASLRGNDREVQDHLAEIASETELPETNLRAKVLFALDYAPSASIEDFPNARPHNSPRQSPA